MNENRYHFIFTFLGIFVGICLSFFQLFEDINIGWFWATFPLWAGFCLDGLALGIILIIVLFRTRKDGVK